MGQLSRRRLWCFRLILLAFGGTLALVIGEGVLRLAGIAYPLPYAPDEQTGSRLRPGFQGWFTKEGVAFARVNSAGFRDREHSLAKPDGTFRILVLGDSYTEALQVDESEAFWSVLERQLAANWESHGRRVEVISMGVSGWGTAQECLALEHYGLGYSPDLVLLAFFAGNDLRNNSRQLEPEQTRPFFVLRHDQLELDNSFRQSPTFLKAQSPWTEAKVRVLNASRLLQVWQEARNRWRQSSAGNLGGGEAGLDGLAFVEPREDPQREAWDVTERIVMRMSATCQQRQIPFVLATVTTAIQVHPDPAVRAAYARQLGVDDLDYADRRIAACGKAHGFSVVDLTKPLRAMAEADQKFLHGFPNTKLGEGHWNAEGHRLAGEVLAKWIISWGETALHAPTP